MFIAVLSQLVTMSFGQISEPNITDTTKGEQFIIIDRAPSFPGGDKKRIKFFGKTLDLPKEVKRQFSGQKVLVSFVIDTSGNVSELKIEQGITASIDSAVVKVLRQMPEWIPAYSRDKKVRCMMQMPVRI